MRLSKARTHSKLVGGALFEIGDVLGSNRAKARRLKDGGSVIVQLRVLPKECQEAIFRFRFRTMEKMRLPRFMRGSPDTIVELAKKRVSDVSEAWVTVYRSFPVQKSDLPSWDEANVDFETLCNGDLEWPIRVSIRDFKKKRLLCIHETTLHGLMDSQLEDDVDKVSEKDLLLLNPRTRIRSSDTVVANLRVVKAVIMTKEDLDFENDTIRSVSCQQPIVIADVPVSIRQQNTPEGGEAEPIRSFHDYVRSTCEIDLCVAIDYTSSNGDPRRAGSLHYMMDENSLNDYEEAIQVVGDALSTYSSSKEFAVWGFGAKFDGKVRHIFQCGTQPTAKGVDGILQAYRSVFSTDFIMSGPTRYDEILQAAAMKARACHKIGFHHEYRYKVLLIITDGVAIDMDETKRKAMVYSQFPLSVIIVGVGRADFRDLYALQDTGDHCRPNIIVVEFRKHQEHPASLARAALERLPSQIVAYMQQSGTNPSQQAN